MVNAVEHPLHARPSDRPSPEFCKISFMKTKPEHVSVRRTRFLTAPLSSWVRVCALARPSPCQPYRNDTNKPLTSLPWHYGSLAQGDLARQRQASEGLKTARELPLALGTGSLAAVAQDDAVGHVLYFQKENLFVFGQAFSGSLASNHCDSPEAPNPNSLRFRTQGAMLTWEGGLRGTIRSTS